MAARKSEQKDMWMYLIEGYDGAFDTFPSLNSAKKAAVEDLQGSDNLGTHRVRFFQLASVIDFVSTAQKVQVMVKETKVEIK